MVPDATIVQNLLEASQPMVLFQQRFQDEQDFFHRELFQFYTRGKNIFLESRCSDKNDIFATNFNTVHAVQMVVAAAIGKGKTTSDLFPSFDIL